MDNAILEKYRGLAMILSYLSFIFSLLGPRSLPLCHIFKLWGIDHANKLSSHKNNTYNTYYEPGTDLSALHILMYNNSEVGAMIMPI